MTHADKFYNSNSQQYRKCVIKMDFEFFSLFVLSIFFLSLSLNFETVILHFMITCD